MSKEISCPHCTNAITDEDTTCTNCGGEVQPLNPLILLCIQFGIPPVIVREDKECPILELRCRAEGIEGIYMTDDQEEVVH